MAPHREATGALWRRGGLIVTGLVMYAFVVTHLANLALGLHSLALMDAWRPWLTGIWTNWLAPVLLVAMVLHIALALWSLYRRNTLEVPAYDLVQLIAGLLIVPLLAPHVTGGIAAREIGAEPSYAYLMPYFWGTAPGEGLRQVLLLAVAWLHGSIGVYTWAVARRATRPALLVFYPLVVLVPVLALLGYVEAGRQALPPELGGTGEALALVEAARAAVQPVVPERVEAVLAAMRMANRWFFWGSLALVAFVLGLRQLRLARLPVARVLRVVFADRAPATCDVTPGLSLWEITEREEIPHAGLCRGRGRCGTCRVRVLRSTAALPPPGALERKTLERVGAGPGVRLACQLVPGPGFLEVERVVAPDYSNLDAEARAEATAAGEATA